MMIQIDMAMEQSDWLIISLRPSELSHAIETVLFNKFGW